MKNIFIVLILILNISFAQKNKSSNYVTTIKSVTETLPSPNFTWVDNKGKVNNFKEFTKGKTVLVNFWATWCGPCRKEMPDLISLNSELEKNNVQFIGISVDRDSDALSLVKDFAKEYKINFPILIDNGEVAGAFGGIRGIPTTFIIDKEGKIVEKIVGMRTKEVFKEAIEKILK